MSTILLVDDDPKIRDIIKEYMAIGDFTLLEASGWS